MNVFTAVAALLAAVVFLPAPSGAVNPNENHVKAVFLYNLVHFVTWPPAGDSDTDTDGVPFAIGIVGDRDFAGIVTEAVRGETKDGSPIKVCTYDTIEDVVPGRDRILFIARNRSEGWSLRGSPLDGQPVLIVGDSPGFSKRGGMINLVRAGSRLHIEVNLRAVERSRLLISAKLLSLATLIR